MLGVQLLEILAVDLRAARASAGTFNCRTVKDTGVRSMHAWRAAIDINTRFSDYWLWSARFLQSLMLYRLSSALHKCGMRVESCCV